MEIFWGYLLLALLLLMPPLPLSPALRKSLASLRRGGSPNLRSLVRPWQNWVDLARAAAGAWLLTDRAIIASDLAMSSNTMLLEGAILAAAVAVQIFRWDPKLQVVAPVFYLSGCTLALSGLTAGVFSVVFGWLFAISARNPSYLLPTMAVSLAVCGAVFGVTLLLIINILLIAIPFAAAFVLRRRLSYLGAGMAVQT